MSYHTYIDYGYGIETTALKKPIEKDRLLSFIAKAPQFKEEFDGWVEDCWDGKLPDDAEKIIEEYGWYAEGYGLAAIMQKVMEECIDGLRLYNCEDYNGNKYLMYLYKMPWYMNDFDRELTEEKLAEYFSEYLAMLTDEAIKADYVESENGG